MSDTLIGFSGMAAVIVFILLGVNVMIVLAAVGFFGIVILIGFMPGLSILSSVTYTTVSAYHFSVIPTFLIMGFFAMRAGLGESLFQAATRWFGRLPGGLAIAATGAAAAFGAASGSSVGTSILFTKLTLPEMLNRGYDKGLASASIAIAGTLAVLIPPSSLIVVYAILTNGSIGPLLMAGIIPGIIFAALLCCVTLLTVIRRPHLAPRSEETYTLREKLWSLRMVGPLLLIMGFIIGGLYSGFFTPTEAGAMGALATLVMAVIRHRGLRGVKIFSALRETVELSAMIFAIIIGGLIFSRFLALSGATGMVGDYFSSGLLPSWLIVLLVTVVYIVLGMLLDPPALLAVTLPITHPVMIQLGYDPVWLGIYIVVLCETACVTPPVGLNCFVVKGAAGSLIELSDIFRGLVPFLLANILMLILLLLFPQIALFLPQSM